MFKTIRYSHLHHEELLETHKNPLFGPEAQELIMQGLSHRLSPFEKSVTEKEYLIELMPRTSYEMKKERPLVELKPTLEAKKEESK